MAFQLAFEAVEHTGSFLFPLGFIGVGVILLAFTDIFIPEGHHHDHADFSQEQLSQTSARKMLVGDALHNVGDGIVLSSAFIIGPLVGLTTAIGILVHELVQEISEFFVLKQAGYSVRKALSLNFATSATILIGSIGGFYLASFEIFEAPLIGIASGAFLYVVLKDLLPTSIKKLIDDKQYTRHIAAFALGLLLILVLSFLTGGH